MKSFLRKIYRSTSDSATHWWVQKKRLLQRHPARVAWHILGFIVVQLLSLLLSLIFMSLLLLLAPTFAFFKGFSLNLNLQRISLPRDFLRKLKEQLIRFTHPSELAQRITSLPTDLRQAINRFIDFLSTHLQDARAFLKERHTFHDWCDKLIWRPLQNHPRIVREIVGFLLAILVAHLLEPLAAPISHRVIAMSDDGRLPHIGLLTFLGINLTAILVVFIGSVIRFASNVVGEFFGNRLTRWFRHRNTT